MEITSLNACTDFCGQLYRQNTTKHDTDKLLLLKDVSFPTLLHRFARQYGV